MSDARILHAFVYPDLIRRAHAGRDPFFATLGASLTQAGFELTLQDDSTANLVTASTRPGFALFRMIDPPHPRGLTFRRSYLRPFFHIERHGRRWEWPVAQSRFDPATINPAKAARFQRNWRHRLFGDAHAERGDEVLVPLQGRLLQHRSFQHCAPIEMLRAQCQIANRPIRATLHPRETYSAEEQDALTALRRAYPHLTVQTGGSQAALLRCHHVVTMNSSVALLGFFLNKPAALCAGIDFHHIAARAQLLGMEGALAAAPDLSPDYAAYLWWFFRQHSIDLTRPDAQQRMTKALQRGGLPI